MKRKKLKPATVVVTQRATRKLKRRQVLAKFNAGALDGDEVEAVVRGRRRE